LVSLNDVTTGTTGRSSTPNRSTRNGVRPSHAEPSTVSGSSPSGSRVATTSGATGQWRNATDRHAWKIIARSTRSSVWLPAIRLPVGLVKRLGRPS
jgi:hypothetical protein